MLASTIWCSCRRAGDARTAAPPDDDPCAHPRVRVLPLALKQLLLRAGEPPRDDHLAARARDQLAQSPHRDVDAGTEGWSRSRTERDEPPVDEALEIVKTLR
jgi:hypothetical protein